MSAAAHKLDPAMVREIFNYEDGALFWAEDRGPRARKGAPAGTLRASGAIAVVIGKRAYPRSHLVFAWHAGRWPAGQLRHLDGQTTNDRIENLRDMPVHELRVLAKSCGNLPGTRQQKGRWLASITLGGIARHLGSYPTEREAHEAFARAHAAAHGKHSPYFKNDESVSQNAYSITVGAE